MENNVNYVRDSEELKLGARGLVDRAVELAQTLLAGGKVVSQTERGGRKANPI
jgi:hypothetical protein